MTLATEDRLALHELVARLDHLVDGQRWDEYVSHFTEDAVLDPGWTTPAQGRTAIRDLLIATEGGTRGKRHVASNVVVDEGGPDEAVVRSYLTVIEREDVPRVVATALITDTARKQGGAWRVARHAVAVDPGMFKAMQSAQ